MDTFMSARQELKEHVENITNGNVTPAEEPMDVYLPGLVVKIPKLTARLVETK
jgi:hypothetical protein